MSFGGQVFDMINQSKQNEALRKEKRDRLRRLREGLSDYSGSHYNIFVDKNRLSKRELEKYKERINAEIAEDRKNMIISGILIIALTIVLLVILLSLLL